MNLFYTPEISGDEYQLDEAESKHCIRVLRHQSGDVLHLVDGRGNWYETIITDDNPKRCMVKVTSVKREFGKSNFYSHIAIAPTKNIDRLEWFLEKATEIGIDEITPILCEHSERKTVNPERMEKIMVAAMKQSLKAYLPKWNKMTTFADLMLHSDGYRKFIAHCSEGKKELLINQLTKGEKSLVFIGPEGDFSESEITLAKQHGFIEVSLGESRLRTETAGLVACHLVSLKNEM